MIRMPERKEKERDRDVDLKFLTDNCPDCRKTLSSTDLNTKNKQI
jgi:hypothetical protein